MRFRVLRAMGRLHLLLLLWVVALLPVSHQLAEAERLAGRSVELAVGEIAGPLLQDASATEGVDPHGPACVICRVLDAPRFGGGSVAVVLDAGSAIIRSAVHERHAPAGIRLGGNARAPPTAA